MPVNLTVIIRHFYNSAVFVVCAGTQSNWKTESDFLVIFPNVTIRSFCLLKTGSTVNVFLYGQYEESIHVILQQISAPLQTLLNYCCTQDEFLGLSQTFSTQLFAHVDPIGVWDFLLLSQSCHFLARVGFEGFFEGALAYNLRTSWSRTIL